MPFIFVHCDVHSKLTEFKQENELKSYNDCIKELFDFWEIMP